MKVPRLQKRYKVIWEYYYSTTRRTTKTFEHVTHEIALEWLRVLLDKPITANVRITDYEGNWKMFEPEKVPQIMRRREDFFEAARAVYGDDVAKKLKTLGTELQDNTPLAIKANFDFIRDRRTLDKYIGLVMAGEKTNPSDYIVAGINVGSVVARIDAVVEGYADKVPPVKLNDYQRRLLKSVKLYLEYLEKPMPEKEEVLFDAET